MQSFISKAAYLRICPRCKQSAVIVCADDTESTRHMTRSRLIDEAGRLAAIGKIMPDEMTHLKHEIAESGLPYRNEALEAFLDLLRANQEEDRGPEETDICRQTMDEHGVYHSVN